ncbi:MAG: hypothetical protein EON54_14980, partial [Alcaligenaceae bacterium]
MRFQTPVRSLKAAALTIALGALTACGGSGSDTPAPDTPVKLPTAKVTVGGVERQYTYYLPSNLDALKA